MGKKYVTPFCQEGTTPWQGNVQFVQLEEPFHKYVH